MGILIFFDDYANTLIVGNTIRPITDRMKISREKLSYIVDFTAAAVASIVPISTWIVFEVGVIRDGLVSVGVEQNAYTTFIQTIPYRFYSLFALVFVLVLIYTERDFRPMDQAEKVARLAGKTIQQAFGDADASLVLLWVSFSGILVAGLIALLKGILTISDVMESIVDGANSNPEYAKDKQSVTS